ncbi:inhibitor of Bruton tyrosine kinase-like isoform X2 [Pomacea canaliculata]|uniref:inhibitor of Bruton tyrosine kinase-like isoform X2 n=1 Tax=Pomacea canaliculata TaxID=400727 RepID=UPI000D73FC2D|nr:inhibitor of Bruton tyrosine kinase-like isoform X2 [Pomacea canaliculata]
MPITFDQECGPKCQSKHHNQEVNAVITRGTLLDFQAYSQLCHTWVQHTDTAGRSALHLAASCGKQDIAEWLITEKKLNVAIKDKESGWTALHRALFYGQLSVARLLIQYNCELYVRDHEGLGPLDLIMKDHPKHLAFNWKDPNEVYSWGDNTNLTLGHASEQRRSFPEVVDTFRRGNISVKQILMSKYHSVFLTQEGQIYTCGHGQGGRLGHGDERTCVTPRMVLGLQNDVCIAIAAARDHTVFLTDKNTLYSCGLNDCHQLGITGSGERVPMDKSLIPLKMNVKLLKGKTIRGIGAGRFHTVVYTTDGVFTCGLNAGQIGQQKGERYQTHLRQVSQLFHKEASIVLVACSDAAIACLTSRGDIFLLHDYTCRKIASRWQEIEKLCVAGGNLDHNTDIDVLREKGGSEIKVVLLSTFGKVFQWRGGSPSMKRCYWALHRQINVSDVALNASGMVLVTDQGEAFAAYFTSRRSGNMQKDSSKDKSEEDFGKMSLLDLLLKDEAEEMSLRRLPGVHRGTYITCDRKGHNCAVLQALPKCCLTDIPCVSESTMYADLLQMMEEADIYDSIHDTILHVGEQSWPVHLFVLASRADFFRKKVFSSDPAGMGNTTREITVHDIHPEVMEQVLKFIYTDTCDVMKIGSNFSFSYNKKKNVNVDGLHQEVIANSGKVLSAFEVDRQRKKENTQKEEGLEKTYRGNDPVKILQEAARKLGVKGLSKRLEGVSCVNNVIQSTGKKIAAPRLKFDRTKIPELYDVCIRAEDGTTVQCHKCILAARLEYFHSMLGSGWIETSDTSSVKLPISGEVLEILLEYVYTDELPILTERPDIELLCSVLVVADQLLVVRLKEMCEEALTALLTLRNVGEVLEFATTYNAEQLQQVCQQFIRLNLPALLENRSLDMIGDETMQDLSNYYRSAIPAMSRRMITPWSEGPEKEYLSALCAEFSSEHALTSREPSNKKNKPRRRQNRTRSISEETQAPPSGVGKLPQLPSPVEVIERQISVSSEVSVHSEEETNFMEVAVEHQPASEDKRQVTYGIPIQNPSKTSHGWGTSILSPSPGSQEQVKTDKTGDSGTLGLRKIMEQEEGGLRNKQVAKTGGSTRFSWKDVKKQKKNKAAHAQKSLSLTSAPLSPSASQDTKQLLVSAAASPVACPWGSVNKVVQSFRELMLQDKVKQSDTAGRSVAQSPPSSTSNRPSASTTSAKPLLPSSRSPAQDLNISWGLPHRPASLTVPSPSSPGLPAQPSNPWHRSVYPSSPPENAATSLRFSDIVRDELQQKDTLEKTVQKPLHLIQMEEEAMSGLLLLYRADLQHDEHITVERASSTMAAPLWRCQRSSAAGHN